ncbi:MAG: SUMF1/EgtB/PvdO family nonheme iron enzyme [Planctomycetota bacterium]
MHVRLLRLLSVGFVAVAAVTHAGAPNGAPSAAEIAKLVEQVRALKDARASAQTQERQILAEARRRILALRADLRARGKPVAQQTRDLLARLQRATPAQRQALASELATLRRLHEEVLVQFLDFARSYELELDDDVVIRFVLVPAGTFTMGSPKDEPGRGRFEGPQHKVTLAKPFYLSATEVTQAQHQAVMGTNPSRYQGGDLPVGNVAWKDASAFCQRLSERTGLTVRLPTEAEWEYACRAGTRSPFSCPEEALDAHAWHRGNARGGKPRPVGGKKPNPWGLHDMHGNVEEWVADWYGSDYYAKSPRTDPQGPAKGSYRVFRGGSCYQSPRSLRSAARGHSLGTDPRRGFRVVLQAR